MIPLKVPFKEKDQAKRLGARWHASEKYWFVPAGVDPKKFARWLPEEEQLQLQGLDGNGKGNSNGNSNGKGNLVSNAIVDNNAIGDTSSNSASSTADKSSLLDFLNHISKIIIEHIPYNKWISAEISEIKQYNRHLYLTLVEHNAKGMLIAKVQARIWQSNVQAICQKFEQKTNSKLTANIKILCKVAADYHPQYGLSLAINDIDPAYTLGEMAAKITAIKQALVRDKIIDLNKRLMLPFDFFRVAVISPKDAAGLGDFNLEANILAKYNLCHFAYFTAVFQGKAAASSIVTAIDEVISQHQANPFDVLVIIRGGGAIADLNWLNEEVLARAVCSCPIPIFSGIGHHKDYTIIDEVVNKKFDTPSKVTKEIFAVITNNAKTIKQNFLFIEQTSKHRVKYILQNLVNLHEKIIHTSLDITKALKHNIKLLITEILSNNPKTILNKGFCLITDVKQNFITSKQQAKQQQRLTIEFHDGKLNVEVAKK